MFDTHLLVLVPETVNGKPFYLNGIKKLFKSQKIGNKTCYNSKTSDYVVRELGGKTFLSHWVLMTRDIIPDSQNKTYEQQQQLVIKHNKKNQINYEIPKMLEVVTAIFMHYIETGEALYSEDKFGAQLTYTRCQEKVNKSFWPVVVGGFFLEGLSIKSDYIFAGGANSEMGLALKIGTGYPA